MRAKSATFVTSAAKASDFPPAEGIEIAIAGRSNVGKSSLINRLVGVDGLARTSRTPGRTQLLNWFRVEPPSAVKAPVLGFVDLPGYGYAKVPIAMRSGWQGLIEAYLTNRPALAGVVLLVDVRRGAESEEQDLAAWLADRKLALIGVVTKIDKLAKNKRSPVIAQVKRDLGLARLPVGFSAQDGDGIDDLWRAIAKVASAPKA